MTFTCDLAIAPCGARRWPPMLVLGVCGEVRHSVKGIVVGAFPVHVLSISLATFLAIFLAVLSWPKKFAGSKPESIMDGTEKTWPTLPFTNRCLEIECTSDGEQH